MSYCLRHSLTWYISCICHGVLDWDYAPGTKPDATADEPDYSRFENFIPRSATMTLCGRDCY